jgi:hypothetical protein
MKRHVILPALVAPLVALLAACGGGGATVAHDPAPSPTTTSGSPSSSTSSSTSAPPTSGTYPHYEPADYGFDLVVSCFCAGANTPIRVTVLHAKVVGAVYLGDSTGRGTEHAGDTADKHYWLTINDVIDAANDTTAQKVKVDWPDGQGYPSSVYVDPSRRIADDEIGYAVSNVQPG